MAGIRTSLILKHSNVIAERPATFTTSAERSRPLWKLLRSEQVARSAVATKERWQDRSCVCYYDEGTTRISQAVAARAAATAQADTLLS